MGIRQQIKCINKTPRLSAHDRISHVGGTRPDSTRWKLTLDQAIAAIEKGEKSFYVVADQREVDVVVAKSAAGNKYLKTVADGEQPNNLLSLPECPPLNG